MKMLTQENMIELQGKSVCCFEKSISYLEELCSKYDILSQITAVVDPNERNQGGFFFRVRT